MIFTHNNVEDIRKYYRNSYVKFRDLGETVCHIEDVTTKRIDDLAVHCVVGRTSEGDLFTLPLWTDQPYEVEYVLPKKGFFIHKEKLYQLRRVPARQYCRGVCADNTSIVCYKHGGFDGVEVTAELLQAYVNKPSITFPSTSDLLKTTPLLLSRRIAILPDTQTVLVDSFKVGSCLANSITVRSLFYPELSALLKGSDIKVEAK